LKAKIDELKVKAEGLEAKALEGYHKQIEKLNTSERKVLQKVQELKGESSESWSNLKKSLEKAMEDLEEGFRNTVSRLIQ
jgi:hypothetical protein